MSRRNWLATAVLPMAMTVVLAPCASARQEAGSQQPGGAPAIEATLLDGVFTQEQANRGMEKFQQICSACHFPAEFTGEAFQRIWGQRSVGELFRMVSGAMPMDAPGSLSPQEYIDIISYFFDMNGYPKGEKELPPDADALSKVQIVPRTSGSQ